MDAAYSETATVVIDLAAHKSAAAQIAEARRQLDAALPDSRSRKTVMVSHRVQGGKRIIEYEQISKV
jgi:hypothetical protein